MELSGKHVIVTGAASGIGRALLAELAQRPMTIIAADRDELGLQTALSSLVGSAQIHPFVGDLSSPETVDRLLAFAIQTMSTVDVFFANAGIAYYENFSANPPDWGHIEQLFRLNVFSPLYTLQKMHALNPERPFRVVVTASAMAHMAYPGYALYGATKAALHRFAESYRFEERKALILTYPIGTRTHFFEQAGEHTPLTFPLQTPEHVARALIRAVERDQRAVYPSALFRLALFLDRFMPPVRWGIQQIAAWQFRTWRRHRENGSRPTDAQPPILKP